MVICLAHRGALPEPGRGHPPRPADTARNEVADLPSNGAADRIVAATVERHGRLDGALQRGGWQRPGVRGRAVHELTLDGWERTMSSTPAPCAASRRGGAPDARPGPGRRRPAWRDPEHGLITSHRPVARAISRPTPMPRQRAPSWPDPDDGRALRRQGIRVNAVAPALTDRRCPSVPRPMPRPSEFFRRSSRCRLAVPRGCGLRGVLSCSRPRALHHRPGAPGGWRLVGDQRRGPARRAP